MEDEEELSSSLSLLLSLSSEEELEESLLSDDESLEEPSESLLLSLESFALRASGRAQRENMNTENRTVCIVIKASRPRTLYLLRSLLLCHFAEEMSRKMS